MTPEQRELWARIAAFELDDPEAALPFSCRLARENGWSRADTKGAIAEYKRFVFLAMCAGHPVAPSDEVDQVWHFHLTYTRSYWNELCENVLPRPLHHGPTRGGNEEGAKFHDWYGRTLESYRQFFGEEPPPAWWPSAHVRFGASAQWVRIDAQRHWIIGKPQWLRRRASTCNTVQTSHKMRWSLALVALLLLMAGCDQVGETLPIFDWYGPAFLKFYSVFVPVVLLGAGVWRRSWFPAAGDVGDHELPRDPYQVAYLNGGATQALQAALVELARRREIEVAASGHISRASAANSTFASSTSHSLEAAILRGLGTVGVSSAMVLLKNVDVAEALQKIEKQLRASSLAAPLDEAIQARNATLTLAALAPLVGVVKIAIGIARDRPVGYLVIITALALLVVVLAFCKVPFRNARGNQALTRLRLRHTNLKTANAYRDSTRIENGVLALAVGLYGLQVLDQTPLANLNLRQYLNTSSGDGGSSSDGGGDSGSSGCGGGCGGCGGGGD